MHNSNNNESLTFHPSLCFANLVAKKASRSTYPNLVIPFKADSWDWFKCCLSISSLGTFIWLCSNCCCGCCCGCLGCCGLLGACFCCSGASNRASSWFSFLPFWLILTRSLGHSITKSVGRPLDSNCKQVVRATLLSLLTSSNLRLGGQVRGKSNEMLRRSFEGEASSPKPVSLWLSLLLHLSLLLLSWVGLLWASEEGRAD